MTLRPSAGIVAFMLVSPLLLGPVDSIAEVLERLEAIQVFSETNSALKEHDGVASFNFLYRIITATVSDKVGTDFFPDDEFLIRLDVAFANRYLEALRLHAASSKETPRSWKVLFERRADDRITGMQFAAAGVNAHINYDLAIAVVATCEELGHKPETGTRHGSYDKVNEIFATEMDGLTAHFQNRLAAWIDDHVLGKIDELLSDFAVRATRTQAWNSACLLWRIRHIDAAETMAKSIQDRLSGLAGHLLLQPVR